MRRKGSATRWSHSLPPFDVSRTDSHPSRGKMMSTARSASSFSDRLEQVSSARRELVARSRRQGVLGWLNRLLHRPGFRFRGGVTNTPIGMVDRHHSGPLGRVLAREQRTRDESPDEQRAQGSEHHSSRQSSGGTRGRGAAPLRRRGSRQDTLRSVATRGEVWRRRRLRLRRRCS